MIRFAAPSDILDVFLMLSETDDSWSIDVITSAFANPHNIILVEEDKDKEVVGAVFMSVIASECELQNIVVSQKNKRRGIGERLLKEALRISAERRADVVYLEVRNSNEPARALYKKLGFSFCGCRKNYYKNPTEDAILMKKKIIFNK